MSRTPIKPLVLPPVRPGRAPEFTARPQASPDYHPLDEEDPVRAALSGRRRRGLRRTVARDHAPAFDPELRLTEVYDSGWSLRRRAWFLGVDEDGDPRRLNGTSPPLHDFRNHRKLKLNPRTAPHWLRFFCYFVHGDEGPFLITEDLRRLAGHTGRPENHRSVAALAEHLQPVARVRTRARRFAGRFVYDAPVHYDTALFRSRFAVSPDGEIEMITDDVLVKRTGLRVRRPLV